METHEVYVAPLVCKKELCKLNLTDPLELSC